MKTDPTAPAGRGGRHSSQPADFSIARACAGGDADFAGSADFQDSIPAGHSQPPVNFWEARGADISGRWQSSIPRGPRQTEQALGSGGGSSRVQVPMLLIRQRDALSVLTKLRLVEIAAALDLGLPGRLLKPELVDAIAASPRAPFPRTLELLMRDELKAICRAAGLDDSGREKVVIAERIRGRADGDTATLTKADLIEEIAAEAGVTKRDAEVMVNAALAAMAESLQAGEGIEIRGFGSFGIRHRGPRTGRNPASGAAVNVPAKRVCYFKPGKKLRLV